MGDPQWFIFTSASLGMTACSVVSAPTISQAISGFKKNPKNKGKGSIVGVIAAPDEVSYEDRVSSSQIYGVICCTAEKPFVAEA